MSNLQQNEICIGVSFF